jgi:putative exosortase-associated protein (TIGR04073 family)
MRSVLILLAGLATVAFVSGCAGPEEKLGRGVGNVTTFARLGEMQRSIEQTGIWDGPDQAYTTGVIRGFNRSVATTAVGVFEIVTFPFPPYGPLFAKGKVYPDPSIATKSFPYGGLVLIPGGGYPESYRPGLPDIPTFSTDARLGFSGGEIAPYVPSSRFRVFDN